MTILMHDKTFAKEVKCFYLQKSEFFTFAHNFNSWPIVDSSSIWPVFADLRTGLVGTFQSPCRQIAVADLREEARNDRLKKQDIKSNES